LATNGSFFISRKSKGTLRGGVCMAQISVSNLTFGYEGSFDNIVGLAPEAVEAVLEQLGYK
jgi:hypothetical protein